MVKRIISFSLAVLLAFVFFTALYRYDNKYRGQSIQPLDGLLVLSEKDLSATPLRFLWHGWAFYSNVLLSPQDFASGNPLRYMEYVSIGEQTYFTNPADPGEVHGSGTYVLRLRLPDEAAVYTLELPEIFSAYRMYADGKLLAEMGNPDREEYRDVTQNRMVSFEKAGDVLIILAVSDYSHFYSGMIYPPAFGTYEAVNAYVNGKMGVSTVVSTVVIIVALLALFLGVRMNEKNAILFALLCVVMVGSVAYEIIHTVFAMPVFPWYALETASVYFVIALVIVLHNRICKTSEYLTQISNITAFIFGGTVLCYGLLAAELSLPVIQCFSWLIFGYKMIVSAYLLVTAWTSAKVKDSYGRPLLYAAVVFAAAIICDRIFPVYEPVYGGFFLEWGCIAIVFAVGYILWRDMVRSYSYSLAFAEEHRQVTRQLAMQVEYSHQLSERADENRRLLHDFRQHIVAIDGLAQKAGDESVRKYLTQVDSNFNGGSMPHIAFSDNIAADALFRYYFALAKEQGIHMEIDISLPKELPLSDVELCTVLGNLLENAYEACCRLKDGERFLYFSSKTTAGMLFILIENSFDGVLRKKEGKLMSAKSDEVRFGIGLESVRRILEQYDGVLDIKPHGNTFEAGISLPLW